MSLGRQFSRLTVHAYYEAEIQARATGYIKELQADIGDYVDAGAVLAVIDVPEMQKQHETIEARIARFEAEQQRAEAGVELASANVRSVEAKLDQARSELNRADASLVAAEAEFKRTQDLVERQSLERRMLDEVRKKRDSQLANKEAVSSAITAAEADVAVSKAQQASAEADVRAAESETAIARRQLEELEVLIEYAELKAPFAGVVTRRTVDPGDLVRQDSPDRGALFVVSHIEKVRVRMPVPEADAASVNVGDAVSLRFPSFPNEDALTATVSRVSGSLDPSTRTMLVEAGVAQPTAETSARHVWSSDDHIGDQNGGQYVARAGLFVLMNLVTPMSMCLGKTKRFQSWTSRPAWTMVGRLKSWRVSRQGKRWSTRT